MNASAPTPISAATLMPSVRTRSNAALLPRPDLRRRGSSSSCGPREQRHRDRRDDRRDRRRRPRRAGTTARRPTTIVSAYRNDVRALRAAGDVDEQRSSARGRSRASAARPLRRERRGAAARRTRSTTRYVAAMIDDCSHTAARAGCSLAWRAATATARAPTVTTSVRSSSRRATRRAQIARRRPRGADRPRDRASRAGVATRRRCSRLSP